ncbi:MAG: aldo/keto reductase [Oscillospiraceae bacterium]|nr:aldo/keto reductase [Oscillospiraceae bacterium]
MIYRTNPKNGDKLSQLGYGGMRFPKDDKDLEKQVVYAIENGVNYFDTAYIYPSSEERLGRVLAKGYREKVKIATKIPPYLVKKYEDLDKIFNTQLRRLQTEYIDYYFIHMITDIQVWNRLVDLGILKWIEEKKKAGQIKNIGFSYHGGQSEFIKVIDSYDWEFCMIYYNFLDENNQAGKNGLEYASKKGLPVMVMGPLKGGKIVTKIQKDVDAILRKSNTKRTLADWSFRWVWNHKEVTVALSGMSTEEMVEENIKVAKTAEADSFTEADFKMFEEMKTLIHKKLKIPCTGCNYCVPYCPKKVDIPTCLTSYNNIEVEGKMKAKVKYIMNTSIRSESYSASQCIKCKKCEAYCPQGIQIGEELTRVKKALEGFGHKPLMFVMKKFMKL